MVSVGYLGPNGTFSHEAYNEYVKKSGIGGSVKPCEYNNLADILLDVQNGSLDEAIVPIENSLEGAVNATMDILASEADLKIKAELVIPIKANLLIKKGMQVKDISCILSHPQPLGQCRNYIATNFPGVEVVSVYSTAGAAVEVANGRKGCAAIGTKVAAEVYGLEIAASDIQDMDNNLTRFVVVGKEDCSISGVDKTSIVFSTEDRPGSLYRILDIFSLWDINMTRIESRPAKNKLGKYIFFIDIIGHKEEEDIREALAMVKRKTSFYKLLGSYPIFRG
ncbi:MAG: prephenate dehydratase [Clostridiales bacterium]|jgi:prephenate dehydratase|nr:prephenate dehydratase [Clostridiales bacterium]